MPDLPQFGAVSLVYGLLIPQQCHKTGVQGAIMKIYSVFSMTFCVINEHRHGFAFGQGDLGVADDVSTD